MKKLIILGGSENQLPLIVTAKKLGVKIVLCDYVKDNPGKAYCDIFHCVSTLDYDAVLDVARKENVDGIVTNSEPAMPVSAYVGNELGLPSNPYKSIVTLSRKDLFRNFLKNNRFACPRSFDIGTYREALEGFGLLELPIMVKPVDSSGSRGISRINSEAELIDAFQEAMKFSKVKRVVIEEFIDRAHDYMIGGDIFVQEGKVAFWGLMNSYRNNRVSEFIPVGTSFPTLINDQQFMKVSSFLHQVLERLGIRIGPFNVEMMFGKDGHLYMIELNPRSGGNNIPQILEEATGVDLFQATILTALGCNIDLNYTKSNVCLSTYVIHSETNGTLRKIKFDEGLASKIVDTTMFTKIGQRV